MGQIIAGILGLFGMLIMVGLWVMSVCAWITHVFVCIKAASWILLVIGAIFFPIGILHGIGIWFGLF